MGKDGKAFTLVTPEQGKLLTVIEVYMNKIIQPDEIEGYVACVPRSRETEKAEAQSSDPDPSRPRMGRDGRPVPMNRYRRAL
jgi:hypothetical protein